MGTYWTVDLGATSGRVMSVVLADDLVVLHEELRFVNQPLERAGELFWDLEELWRQTLTGLERAAARARQAGRAPDGVAADAWGVDFALVDEAGAIGLARHYRSATAAAAARVQERVPAAELFRRSGVTPMDINTVFRLAGAVAELGPAAGATMLLIGDLWTFRLGGERAAELTIAGTTSLLDIATRTWDRDLLGRLGLDPAVLPRLRAPGTRAGTLRPSVAARIGTGTDVPVMRTAGHDTAAAVAAIGGSADGLAFISCGTWALAGVETTRPVLSEAAFAAGFTNELGTNGRVLFMRNLTGLWLLEQVVATWRRRDPALSLDTLLAQAAARPGPTSVIDVGAPALVHSSDVPAQIRQLCADSGQPVPGSAPELVRCILLSLAVTFRQTLLSAGQLTGVRVAEVHLVGGGTRNALLCQLVADTCALPVIAGPAEATSLGNALVQAWGHGEVESAEHIRHIVRNSHRPVTYHPAAGHTASGV